MNTVTISKPDADLIAAILGRCDPPYQVGGPGWGPDTIDALASFAEAAEAGQVVEAIVQATRILKGTCPWTAEIDGEDIVVRNVIATCFGGAHDSGDDGQTESGVLNNGSNPELMGVALPIRSTEAATAGTPLAFPGPHIPWKTPVMVWRDDAGEDSALACILIDNGPDDKKYPTHALDVNPNVALKLTPGADPLKVANEWGESGISYRILGGAKYAPSA